jgi:hypothetical protein
MPIWLKRVLLFVAVFIGCVPITAVLAIALTPLLWKLEDVVHVELAGHSGPSDWVICLIYVLVVVGALALLARTFRKRERSLPD